MTQNTKKSFRWVISTLETFWAEQSCVVLEPYDMPMGAATFHPATFLRSLGDEPWRCVFVQGCRRPSDGRYGDNPNRLQHYYQMQVVLKPPPDDIQKLYLKSLAQLGIDAKEHDIRFVEDDWKSPTLGASGLGWEVWIDGLEVCQFTYFQKVGGVQCAVPCGEITYGLERIAMFLQNCDNIFDLVWDDRGGEIKTYRDIFHNNEKQQSAYNLDYADVPSLTKRFEEVEKECKALLKKNLPLPAYDQLIHASHIFNVLDARHAFGVTERQQYMLRTRKLAAAVVKEYLGDE